MKQKISDKKTLIISYLTLRKCTGILGVALPFVVALGALLLFRTGMQSSISSYYHTGMRDVFVGILSAIGIFLLSYKGEERRDDIAGDLGCVFALGVAFFPTTPEAAGSAARIIGGFHLAFAGLFFSTLIYFSLLLFTKTDPKKKPSGQKLKRNRVYRACGYIMSACIGVIIVNIFVPQEWKALYEQYNPVFWLEALAIVAFGVSWLTKGEAILKDRE